MLELVGIELKRRLRNPLTWFIIAVLCLMSLLNIIEMKNKRLDRHFIGHDIHSFGSKHLNNWAEIKFDDMKKELYPKQYNATYVYTNVPKQIAEANKENNIPEINRLLGFYHLLIAKKGYVTNDPIRSKVFEKKVMDMWIDISGGIPYDDIDFYPIFSGAANTEDYSLLWSKYYHQLYIKDLEPIYPDDANNITYTYNYFFDILPQFIIIITILLAYNNINKDKNLGSLKLLFTQSVHRKDYYIGKWISGVIQLVFIFLLPPIIINILLWSTKNIVSMKYPVLHLKDTIASFKSIPNYLEAIKVQSGYIPTFGDNTTFSRYAPGHELFIDVAFPHRRMEFISFYKYLLMVLLLTILFIAFAVGLTQLISAIINKEIISFVAISAIFATGILISSPFKYGEHLNLSPFTMEHASRIVIGTYNVTALTSIIILSLSTLLLLTIGVRYFNRKEI